MEQKRRTIIRNKGKRLNQYVPDYVVFDLETTGISTQKDSIIEISAVKVRTGNVIEEFSTLVNPGRDIPAGATAVNGITDAMVKNAPSLGEVLDDFLDFIEDEILVGHNIHTFDTNFVYDAAVLLYEREVKNNYIDTLYLARKCLPQLKHHTLGDVSSYFHICTKGAHRALNDCIMNQKCFEELGKMLSNSLDLNQSELCCPACGSELVVRRGRYGQFYGCSGYPRCKYTQNV